MAVILIPLSFLLLFWALNMRPRQDSASPHCWRESLLLAAVVFGLLLAAATELLNLFKGITTASVAAFWGLVVLIVGAICVRLVRRARLRIALNFTSITAEAWQVLALLAFTAVPIAAATLLIALVAPPNNWDSMTYHMARVVHWIQQHSLAFYPTHIPRQIHLAPGAEYAILHLQILSGGDRFANLVQWSSMVGSLVGVSLIAKRLGADSRGQAIASAVAAALPMGILQATSTQNDHVVAFWLVCFAYFVLSPRAKQGVDWMQMFGAAGSLGLAVLTKATTYIFALPFLAWLALSLIRQLRWKSWRSLVLVAIIGLTLNLGHYMRNWDLYGSPLGPMREGKATYYNEVFSVPHAVSNIVRNAALHLETPLPSVNAWMTEGIFALHRWLHVDASDIRTTFAGLKFTRVAGMTRNDATAGNPVHLFLIAAVAGGILFSRRIRSQTALVGYAACLASAFLIFCLYLKWQPWGSRLHLPLFILWSPAIAVAASRTLNRRFVNVLAVSLVVMAIPWVVGNQFRPLVGQGSILRAQRLNVYFYNRPQIRKPYLEASAFLKSHGCSRVGLICDHDAWEYPLWVVLQRDSEQEVRIEHVAVINVSGQKLRIDSSDLCGIVSFSSQGDEIVLGGKTYASEFYQEPVRVYLRR